MVSIKYILLSTLISATMSEYVPGTPGGPWSSEELMIVRAKLWRLMSDDSSINFYNKKVPATGLPEPDDKTDLSFFAAKLLRLSFHDCIKYTDGKGGCDGCLNWKGVGVRFIPKQFTFEYPDAKETNNNGLEYAVAVLEELYTNPNFPVRKPILAESLKSSGKSRADLWSYAAKVAVEYSIERNNFHCAKNTTDWAGPYIGKTVDCQRSLGKPDCELHLPREIRFQYGRKDCISSHDSKKYIASKEEVHPNPEGNGDDTLNFFQSQFNFTGREIVAILGAHTLGRMYPSHSLLKYTWTSRGGNMFNNAYYRNFVSKDEYFYESYDNNQCLPIGDAMGNIPDTKWIPTMNGFTKSGGPMHWIKMHFACPQCTVTPRNEVLLNQFNSCCIDKPTDMMCKPDNASRNDKDDIVGCERYRFAFGLDEMAMNAEMGLYFKFDQENGIPTNCPGFNEFNMNEWTKKNNLQKTRRAYNHGCSLNMRREPATDLPLSTLFQTYADDQAAWVSDFIPTFEKMMSNGYTAGELTDAPSSWKNTLCTKRSGLRIDCNTVA